MQSSPLVSCIMPTANRRRFVPRAIQYFLRQDYPNKELVILDDGAESAADLIPNDPQVRYTRLTGKRTLGKKRNDCIEAAGGDLIMHWDDDDWHAPHRIRYQVEALLKAHAEVCSVTQLLFYELATGSTWLYRYTQSPPKWLMGGTLLYTRAFWQRSPFPNMQVASDTRFILDHRLDRAAVMADYRFYVAIIHPNNTSFKQRGGAFWSRWSGNLHSVMGEDLRFYEPFLPDAQKPIVKSEAAVKTPTYAILMVTHNALEVVRIATLRTLRHSEKDDARLVVVDNASTDGTAEWLAGLAARGDIDLIQSKSNLGHGPALELARSHSSSPFLVTLDSDAFPLTDDWLAQMRARLIDPVKAVGILHHRDYIHPSCLMIARETLDQFGLTFLNEKGQPSNFDVAERISYEIKRRDFQIAGLQRTDALRRGSASEPVYLGANYEGIVYHQWYTTRAEISPGRVDDVPPDAIAQSLRDLFDADARQPREITVIVGIHITDEQPLRWRNILACLQALNQQDIARWRYQIVLVEQDSQPRQQDRLSSLSDRYIFAYNPGAYNRGWAFNIGALLPSVGGALCLLDADLLVPPNFLRMSIQALQMHRAVRPYTDVRYLEASASEQALREFAANPTRPLAPQHYRGRSFDTAEGGCIWIEADLYREIGGHDERFRGWGREDREFSRRLARATTLVALPGTLLHLYHEPARTDDRWASANLHLFEQIERKQATPSSQPIGDINRYRSETPAESPTKPKRDWENWTSWEATRIDRIVTDEMQAGRSSARRRLAHILIDLGDTLLDVGCGPGALWSHLWQLKPNFRWVGADVTPAMLRGAQRHFPDIPILNADAGALPFANSSFDIVLMRHLLEHLPQWLMERVLQEAIRVARYAVVVDFFIPPLALGGRSIKREGQNFLRSQWLKTDIEQPIHTMGWQVAQRYTLPILHSQVDEVWVMRSARAGLSRLETKISIIMPTYQRAHTIYRTIDTIRTQTYDNWELIIVDNSGDGLYNFDDQRIRCYRHTERASAAYARNQGLQYATGDLICFFDDDDDMYSDYLQCFVNAFEAHPQVKLVRCGMEVSGGNLNYSFATPECCIRRQYATPTWIASGQKQDQQYFKSLIEKNRWLEANGDIVSLPDVLCRANADNRGGLRSGHY